MTDTNPAQRLVHLLTKQASTPLSREESAELHTRQGLRTCANCDHSFNADPKCGLCCGPSFTSTRWQCVDISQLKSAPPAPAKVPHTVRWSGLFQKTEYKEFASLELAEAWVERAGVARICTILPTRPCK